MPVSSRALCRRVAVPVAPAAAKDGADDERDLAVSPSQDKGRDGGTAPRDTVGGSVRPGSDGNS